jgi:YidC/Oxa1 family membrane protein insertase
VWDVFQGAIFEILKWFYGFTHDWGMAILLITILFRLLISPITQKQFKSTYAMQKLQPRIKEIRAKYAEDPQRQQQETTKLYQEAKFNPLAGCLPMLLQMPIFMGLFWMLRDIKYYIIKPYIPVGSEFAGLSPGAIAKQVTAGDTSWDQIVAGVPIDADQPIHFYNVIHNLTVGPSQIYAESGISLALLPYALLVLLFGVSMLIPLLINKNTDRQTLIMTGVMGIMMIWFGWISPAGVLLYWDTSSLLGVAQQYIARKMMAKKDEEQEAIEIKPVKVEVERRERKNRPKKSK